MTSRWMALFLCSLAAACGDDVMTMGAGVNSTDGGRTSSSSNGTGGGRDMAVAAGCAACSNSQICMGDQCVDLPQQCPCPKEAYCDLSSSHCRPGCLADGDCTTGRICDNRQCHAGCRADGVCGVGNICDASTSSCRAGCRADADCKSTEYCQKSSLTCQTGCRGDTSCNGGQICDKTTRVCRNGCMQRSDCGATQYCDVAARACKDGCVVTGDCMAPSGSTCQGGMCVCTATETNCDGACVNLMNDAKNCMTCGHACPVPVDGYASCTAGSCSQHCSGFSDFVCGGTSTQAGSCCQNIEAGAYCCMNAYCLKSSADCI